MKNILVLGAGKSATNLIEYLLKNAQTYDWFITVGDFDVPTALKKVGENPRGRAVFFDVHDADARANYINTADIVASVLPATYHILVAHDCLRFAKHLITPSYISPQERALDADFKNADLLFMGEMGLDPGIDHMSLMQMIHNLRNKNAQITEVRSYCGALIDPESDNNPWHYKFTWAPMNVVLAGQGGTAQYLQNGKLRYIPYNRLFSQHEVYEVAGYGTFEAYANRDSVPYQQVYQIEDVPTLLRGTLRKGGFCNAWQALVSLGLTDNQLQLRQPASMTWADLTEAFLPANLSGNLADKMAAFLGIHAQSEIMYRLKWLGLFSDMPINKQSNTAAQALLHLLTDKWQLQADDKDMIVMLHKINYLLEGKKRAHTSTMVISGSNADHTAIAATVGLPMAIMTKLVITNAVQLSGVHLPVMPQVYEPVLTELKQFGIDFTNTDEAV